MIAALLLLLAPAPQTAVDAERAFAARAQAAGQWRAFAEYAAPDAVMFVPDPVRARIWLATQKEPARAVAWRPSASYVSCDGDTAVNTGPWRRAGSQGYFTTVWRRGADGWRWVYDGGDALSRPRASVAAPRVEAAACAAVPPAVPQAVGPKHGGGASRDRSLVWAWRIDAGGVRRFTARLWTGRAYRTVIADVVAAH